MCLVTLACLFPAAVASAQDPHPLAISKALRGGCAVQQVHTPAGKTVQTHPVVRCPDARPSARDAAGRDATLVTAPATAK